MNKKKKLIITMIPIVIILLFVIFISVDLSQVKAKKKPIFVVHVKTYEDGNKKYIGLLYSVYSIKEERQVGLSVFAEPKTNWELTPWFTSYDKLKP